jgi:hypothetical protein
VTRTIECDTEEVTTIQECFEYALETVDARDMDSLAAVAPKFRMLSNNSDEVARALCQHLKDFTDVEYGGVNYSPNSFLLSPAHEDVIIRANVWRPLCKDPGRREFEAHLFAYHRAHDHNFSFLTVGHFGPGYETDLYIYDRQGFEGYIGERVRLELKGRATLTPGKVMLYEAAKDIHTQYPPPSVSVSLNLVVVTDENRIGDQYFFDTDAMTLSGFSDTQVTKRVSLVAMAGFVFNDDLLDVLEHLATKHPCARTRLQALKSLAAAKPAEFDRWESIAACDATLLVRSFGVQARSVANTQDGFDPAFMQLV